jgi:hypothetical protein
MSESQESSKIWKDKSRSSIVLRLPLQRVFLGRNPVLISIFSDYHLDKSDLDLDLQKGIFLDFYFKKWNFLKLFFKLRAKSENFTIIPKVGALTITIRLKSPGTVSTIRSSIRAG